MKTAAEKGSLCIESPKVCTKGLARTVRDIVNRVEERVARERANRLED